MNLLAHAKHADILFVSSNTDGTCFMQLVLLRAHFIYYFVESVNVEERMCKMLEKTIFEFQGHSPY